MNERGFFSETLGAFLIYAALTIVMTWPLALGISRDVPGDLGDSLLNMWILGWGAEQVPRMLAGQASVTDYWNANIFHPEPLALGFSEHLFGEVLQILPVYWLTGNLILCYNLLFLSSFALSGLAMFVFVRDLLGPDARGAGVGRLAPAFVAGLIFAFVPFRIAQVAHIQSLHAYWMPFALLGFRRYIHSRRWQPLAAGSAALVMQNWSNGYYLLFFAPFVPVFVIHQAWTAGRLRDARMWSAFAAAAAVIVLSTLPFLTLYLETQRVHGFDRPFGEVVQFSADVYSYLTAPEALGVWGDVLQPYPKPEGELFFGFVPWFLFVVALLALATEARRHPTAISSTRARVVAIVLASIIVIQTFGILAIVFTGGFITSVAGVPIRATNASRLITTVAVAGALLLLISRPARQRAVVLARSPVVLCAIFVVVSLWLSLGPLPQSRGRMLAGVGLYSVLYDNVPGFAGLRVPARYAMIAALFLAVVAAYGVRRLSPAATATWRNRSLVIALLASTAFLTEAWFAPLATNVTWGTSVVHPPARVYARDEAPAVYHQLAGLREDAVVAEFPFGDVAWELRYVYYSTVHWRRLVNGYSGGFPPAYLSRVALLQRVRDNPDAAWRALKEAGTTHVVVHERAFPAGESAVIVEWLDAHFAVEIARFEGDRLFDVTGVWPPR